MRLITMKLSEEMIEYAKKMGFGQMSNGIRLIIMDHIRDYAKKEDKEKTKDDPRPRR